MKMVVALFISIFSVKALAYEVDIQITTDQCTQLEETDRLKLVFFKELALRQRKNGPATQLIITGPTLNASLFLETTRPITEQKIIMPNAIQYLIVDFGGISSLSFPQSAYFAWPKGIQPKKINVSIRCHEEQGSSKQIIATTTSAEIELFDDFNQPIQPAYDLNRIKEFMRQNTQTYFEEDGLSKKAMDLRSLKSIRLHSFNKSSL